MPLTSAQGAIIVVGSILISITLHELMHGLVAFKLGDDTAKLMGRLSLNPLKHIDPITTIALPLLLYLAGAPPFGAAKPVPINPSKLKGNEFGSALVAISGPLTNLVLAFISGMILKNIDITSNTLLAQGLYLFTITNIGFFVFNMIPFPPLDGSRVLYAVAPEPLQRVMDKIEGLGFLAIAIFIMFFYSFISPVLNRIALHIAGFILS